MSWVQKIRVRDLDELWASMEKKMQAHGQEAVRARSEAKLDKKTEWLQQVLDRPE